MNEVCSWLHRGSLLQCNDKGYDKHLRCLIDTKQCDGDEDSCRVLMGEDEDE